MNQNILKKLLNQSFESLPPLKSDKKLLRKPGRPKIKTELKARNFTLCLPVRYLDFLDKITVKDPKVKGRGRKVRFIIDRFIEHEKRSLAHMKILRSSLHELQKIVSSLEVRVKKEEQLTISNREKSRINEGVDQVYTLLNILNYSPKSLERMLLPEDRAILNFALNWKSNREIRL